ncbi:ATP-binding protein [Aquibacillus koreensis]|uniref:histidine kinase n=1 Tax=Aquibacillus koreensis TaxID=279446 RepID=A0A9X4ALB7_9BACI|nr:ATP-binding protein [Aquibacillus koreensis]MCT2535468.1 ATP-binding protein [Aquibacillus koreensis]MDC3422303.1 ATP-binding protein [Aquibacillus koreensis]
MGAREKELRSKESLTLQELTNQKELAHLLYMYNEQDKYIMNAVLYIEDGLNDGDHILFVERKSIYMKIKEILINKGYTESDLSLVSYMSSDMFYLNESGFDSDESFKELEKVITANLDKGMLTRTWGHVLADESSISEILKYESKVDTLLNENGIISVCAYNALTTPAFFQNELLKIHEYLLTDEEVVKSPYYHRQYVSFPLEERKRVGNLEKEIHMLKNKNEKLLMDKARQKEREKFLKKEKSNADQANHAKSVFLSQMSHDLRTPLNTIQGYAQILMMNDLTRENRDKVDKILRSSDQLLQLIEEILDFSSMDMGSIHINKEEVQLKPILEECVGSILDTQKSNIMINLDNISEDIYVEADHLRLNQVMTNLLDNAMKYNSYNGIINVYCEVDEKEEQVKISVQDNGSGIDPKEIDLIFEPFYRSQTHMKGWKGTGLGLAIVAQLMTRMDGTFGVTSEKGIGSTFWVGFKRINQEKSEHLDQAIKNWSPSSYNFRVLYIEDNHDNIEVMKSMLDVIGNIDLHCTTSGRSGLKELDKLHPDYIFLDLSLPDLQGFDILSKLKKNPKTKDIPVIVVSADAMEATIETAADKGAFAYMTKPINFEELRKLFV